MIYGVSRSGYYKWLQRCGNVNRYELSQQILDTYVSDIHAHNPMMGYRSIRDSLALQFGWLVSDPSVWKSMKRLKVHGYTRRGKKPSVGSGMEHMRYPNLLQRNFEATAPMQKVVTDVTYLKFGGKWFYLAAYLDLYNNEILEWELSDTFDNFLVMKPAERLLKRTESTEHQVLDFVCPDFCIPVIISLPWSPLHREAAQRSRPWTLRPDRPRRGDGQPPDRPRLPCRR
jgi:putative transposase